MPTKINKRERGLESKWIVDIKKEGARVRHFIEYGPRNPYDGMIGFYALAFSYEAKHSTNKVRHSFKAWREGPQGHQFEALRKDYLNRSAYPFQLIFWEPVKDQIIKKVALMEHMVKDSMLYRDIPEVKTMKDIARLCIETYGIVDFSLPPLKVR